MFKKIARLEKDDREVVAPLERVHICRLSSLDGISTRLPARQYRAAVLEALRRVGRFSSFEVTPKLGALLDGLVASGEIEIIRDEARYSYPWVGVRVRELVAKKGRGRNG